MIKAIFSGILLLLVSVGIIHTQKTIATPPQEAPLVHVKVSSEPKTSTSTVTTTSAATTTINYTASQYDEYCKKEWWAKKKNADGSVTFENQVYHLAFDLKLKDGWHDGSNPACHEESLSFQNFIPAKNVALFKYPSELIDVKIGLGMARAEDLKHIISRTSSGYEIVSIDYINDEGGTYRDYDYKKITILADKIADLYVVLYIYGSHSSLGVEKQILGTLRKI